MKTEAMDIIALCPDIDTVREVIDGYMNTYNNERYQYSLAGLTPSEFYIYATTGVYLLDNYFGVRSIKLSVGDLISARLKKASEKAKKRRLASQKRREERALLTSPASVIACNRDYYEQKKRNGLKAKKLQKIK